MGSGKALWVGVTLEHLEYGEDTEAIDYIRRMASGELLYMLCGGHLQSIWRHGELAGFGQVLERSVASFEYDEDDEDEFRPAMERLKAELLRRGIQGAVGVHLEAIDDMETFVTH